MSNGIDFVIGGKNQASAPMNAVEKSMQRLQAGTTKLKSATQGLMASMAPLLAVLAAVKTVMAAVGGIKAANEAFDAQTESVKRLNAALQIRGAQGASAGMQQVAKDLEKLTGVSDQTTLGLMNQAQSMGFATGAMDDAAKAALGLAAATGKDASASLADMKAALEGNFEAFHGLNPQIMFMRTNQQKLAAVMAIANQGLAAQSQDMGTVAGSGRRADSAMSTLMETFGAILAPIRVLINAGLQQLSTSLTSLLAPAAEYATSVLENIGPMMDYVKEKIVQGINIAVGAFTFFETVLTNLDSVWEMAIAYAEMSMISIKENIMHVLTVEIPAYAAWFAENFVNLIKDAFNGVIAVITNAGKIIGDMVYEIFAFIASGGEGGVEGLMDSLGRSASRSLLDGFESSLTSLPDIAARQLTQREKDLAEKIGAIGGRLGEEFSDKMRERMLGVGDDLSGEISAATSNINLKGRQSVMTGGITATEGRLLTRGPGTRLPDQMQQIIDLLRNPPAPRKENKILVQIDPAQMQTWEQIQQNTANTLQMEAIA
jgi:uncharacterized protein YoxC